MKPLLLFMPVVLMAMAVNGQKRTDNTHTVTPGPGNMELKADSSIARDIATAYDMMEASLEQMYAKLIRDTKNNKEDLENQIKEIDREIEKQKELARGTEQQLARQGKILDSLVQQRSSFLDYGKLNAFASLVYLTTAIANNKASKTINHHSR